MNYSYFCCTVSKFSSVQFSHSVVSESLWPHELQHARPPCPSPTPRIHSKSHPLSRCCHSAILSSVVSFFSCYQSLPASESFPMSQLFPRGGQSIGVSALASVFPKNTQDWSPLFIYFLNSFFFNNLNFFIYVFKLYFTLQYCIGFDLL